MKPQTKYAFTGRMRIGKDFTANQILAKTFGFADPLYQIAQKLFPGSDLDKDKTPGLRKFYQELGQLGRGEITEEYPLSLTRAVVIDWWRHNGDRYCDMPIVWTTFGSNPLIWTDCLIGRIEQHLHPEEYVFEDGAEPVVKPSGLVAVSNVRFDNERAALKELGWDVWHIMASRETWEQRLRQAGISPSDPKLEDLSEQLAIRLDKHVLETVRRQRVGPKLMVIWNDSRPSPSPRLYTLDEFKTYVKSRNPTDTKRTSETSEPAPGSVAIPKCDSDPPARGAGDRDTTAGRRVRGPAKG